jgi:hypothetical protein
MAFTQFGSLATPFGTSTFTDFSLGGATASLDPAVFDLTAKVSASQFKLSSASQEGEGASLALDAADGNPFAITPAKQEGPSSSDAAGAAAGASGAAQSLFAGAGMALSDAEQEQVLQLRSSLEQLVTCDDAYDAHPCMLPLVLFLEKAQQLPAEAPGKLDMWHSGRDLCVCRGGDAHYHQPPRPPCQIYSAGSTCCAAPSTA